MYSNVRPFVTLSYGQRLCRSRAAEGSNPTWNEQLQLQLTGEPSELRDDIKISLFDELIEQQYTDEAADLYQRLQCNWLGEYRIPIRSLLTNRKVCVYVGGSCSYCSTTLYPCSSISVRRLH